MCFFFLFCLVVCVLILFCDIFVVMVEPLVNLKSDIVEP